MSSGQTAALRRRVLLSGTMLVAAAAGYGRRAYGACVNSGGSTYQCSGANAATQTITANNAAVSTLPGFSVTTAAGNAITITGDGAQSYTDTNASSLTASAVSSTALYIRSGADFAATPGSVTINTNGALTGGDNGILARNFGSGATTVTANGDVGTNFVGINANNSAAGSDLTVTTGANTTVSSNVFGILTSNQGTGATTITVNGDVTGTGGVGISATNSATATALSVTTGAGTTVSGSYGIVATNQGTGALTITANGNVTGTGASAISAYNAGTTLSVTTSATVSGGGSYGVITASNRGSGALTITANGDVTGTAPSGINAANYATALNVTTGAATRVSGGYFGIRALNFGTGALTITANGDVTGTRLVGILAHTYGTSLSVTTAAGTAVSGGDAGIDARNYGSGALTITANGNVTGTTGSGINAFVAGSSHGDLSVTTGAGSTVRGGNSGIDARNYGSGALSITANGNVSGAHYGINAKNGGTGALTIIANGDVTANTANGAGISARNYGTSLSVTTAVGTTVRGYNNGIQANNFGTGALTITVNGDVSAIDSNSVGILAANHGASTSLSMTAATGSTVSGGYAAMIAVGAPATITVAGTVSGGTAGAILFDQTSAFANRLELVTGAVITGNVLGGTGTDTLGLSGSGSGSFNVSQLVSFEAGQKTGSGSWTLTGTNTGITAFSVGGGTLAVNGTMTNAAMTVSAGGALGGTGTVGNTSITGGTFAPGSGTPGSSMTVNGTLGFNAASTFAVNVNPSTSSFANVSGTATLGGAAVNATFASGSYISKQYTILTAGSVSGSFGALTNASLPANFHDTLSYDATHAYLNLILNFTTPAPGGLSGNQNNVANALINFFNTTGGIPAAFSSLNANGLTQVSGESATGSQQTTFNAMNQFMGVMTDPFIDGRGDGPGGGTGTAPGYASTQKPAAVSDAYAMFTKVPSPSQPSPASGGGLGWGQRWSVWAAGYGGSQTSDGNAALGSNTATSRLAGTAVGADYRFSPNTIAGFALAGGGTSFSVNGVGSGRSDLFQAGAFIRHTVGPAYLTAALAYGWQDITTDRTVTIAGIDRLHAEFNANAWLGRVEGGYRFVSPWIGGLGITPYAAGQFTTFDLPAYAEQALVGANTFALAYGSRSVTDSRSELGLRTDKSFAAWGGVLALRGRAAWAHDFNPDRAIGATFQTLPGASFVVNGARQASDSALTTASAEFKWSNGWSAAATFEGEFSDVSRSYAGKGVVRYAW